jgi:hypothetical protein
MLLNGDPLGSMSGVATTDPSLQRTTSEALGIAGT